MTFARGASRGPDPAVTVVVPNLNGARFLDQALRSVAGQTWPHVETIVVDGGSTDASLDIVRAWEPRLSLRWISEPDTGQSDAINKGMQMANGDLLTWLNSDDLLAPGAVETVAKRFAGAAELGFVWGFCLVIDEAGVPKHIINPFVRGDLADLRRHRNFVPQPGSFFSRQTFESYGPLDESYHFAMDYELFLRFAGVVAATFVPEITAMFRLHPYSKTGKLRPRFLAEEVRAFRDHGGRWLSPFGLAYARERFMSRPVELLKHPLRLVLWRLLGLDRGDRLRA